jgi:hypothetical protein
MIAIAPAATAMATVTWMVVFQGSATRQEEADMVIVTINTIPRRRRTRRARRWMEATGPTGGSCSREDRKTKKTIPKNQIEKILLIRQ